MTVFADIALARRLERAEAEASRSFVETRARLDPSRGAAWIDVAGTYALFDGVGSPLTQTFGLGIFAPAGTRELGRLEAFFADRGADTHHEVSPLAEATTFAMLAECGYRPIELSSVLYRSIDGTAIDGVVDPRIAVRRAGPAEADLFAAVAARGWSDTPEVVPFLADLSQVFAQRPGGVSFLAELDGVPIAAGSLSISEGVALLAGASTVPAGRRRGAQLALLRARLDHARDEGCDLAMMGATPGSGSQRNAERNGFRVAYTRVKWARPAREQRLAHVALVVRDYDEAIAFFTEKLDFDLIEDTIVSPAKRWVVVAPPGHCSAGLVLARAATPEQAARIGNQTGGRVFLFLRTSDFERDYRTMTDGGVRFVEPPRDEPYGRVAIFEDLYGNRWDLVERRQAEG